jgi:hypothetical protein
MDLENFYVTPCFSVMITRLRWWNTLYHKIPEVGVQRERNRQIGTHLCPYLSISLSLYTFFLSLHVFMNKYPMFSSLSLK